MEKNVLKVRMLGTFSLEYKGKELVLDRNKTSKTTQLFQLLMFHTEDGGISKAAMIDALYGRVEVENKNGSLNNTIFRLRKQLKDIGLPDSKYINIQSGMCRWDGNIEVQVDVNEFRKLIEKEKKEKREEDKLHLWMQAWKIYKGEFLPDMIGEQWVAVENVRCRDEYFRVTKELCRWLKGHERYEDLHKVAHRAAGIYPFDEWQVWEIDSLIGMSRYKEGLEVYQNTEKLLFDEMGVAPSERLLKRFKLMGERTSQAAGAIEDIKYRLKEKEAEPGAYYCAFPSFVDVYHVFSRMMERTGISVFIMLCTLDFGGREVTEEEEKNMSELLRQSIQHSARKGDFYTRYSYTQYLIMFSEIKLENCKIVSDRIRTNFEKSCSGDYSVDFHVTSIADIDRDEDVPEKYFLNASGIWKE